MADRELDWSGALYRDARGAHAFDMPWVGRMALETLDALCVDVTSMSIDEHGWTDADYEGLHVMTSVDHLGRILMPSATTSPDMLAKLAGSMVTLRTALPFSEAERNWLYDDPDGKGAIATAQQELGRDVEYNDVVRQSSVRIVSAGLYRVVHGRDLMQRWWSWRRATGEYADAAGLNQARESLSGLIALLAPELGLPTSYTALCQPPSPEAPSS
jgi:hypothetical protein